VIEPGKQRKKVQVFEDLLVWQKGMELVKEVYLVSEEGRFRHDFALRDQLRRAAISIPTNIAEGFERASKKEYLNFLNFAKGSAGEVRSLLHVASELGYLEEAKRHKMRSAVLELSRYLYNHIKSLRESAG
jgi:four helix bundle protein